MIDGCTSGFTNVSDASYMLGKREGNAWEIGVDSLIHGCTPETNHRPQVTENSIWTSFQNSEFFEFLVESQLSEKRKRTPPSQPQRTLVNGNH